jgi:molecular chaperone DnaK (HSP70)
MKLYENKNTITAKNSNKELPLSLVIQKCLEKIKEIAITQITKNRPNLANYIEKIKWVVTVPSIWEEAQKNIMMEACIGAGLVNPNNDKSLFFALEPEAASLYCSINKEIDRNSFNEGEYYIVCDLGGGTGDIVAHLVGSNNSLNEIYPSCGGKFGSNEIDNLIFNEIIFKLFGYKEFNSFYSKYKEKNVNIENNEENIDTNLFIDWLNIENQIKGFKESISSEKITNNDKYSIDFSLFRDIYDDNTI